jgi:hypothetical protein
METLLDHHLPTFDRWLHAHFMPLNATFWLNYYLAVIALWDQLNPKQFDWHQVSVILQHPLPFTLHEKLPGLFDEKGVNIEFIRIVSKFLMDPDRAGFNFHIYGGLAKHVLEILGDK